MVLNLSQTKSARASRKYAMLHHEQAALSKLRYIAEHKEEQKLWQKAWIEQNKEYYREYMRISNAIHAAHRKGDYELEAKLRIDRKMHQSTLANRMTRGKIVT